MAPKSKQDSFSKRFKELKKDKNWRSNPKAIELLAEELKDADFSNFKKVEIKLENEYAPVSVSDFEPIGWDSPY